jgi:hypothetical protein
MGRQQVDLAHAVHNVRSQASFDVDPPTMSRRMITALNGELAASDVTCR